MTWTTFNNFNLYNNYIYYQYLPILIFFIICIIVVALILIVSILSTKQLKNPEKISAYECGFDPFNYKDIKSNITIRFYLVGILFLIFDIELIFLYPWAISLTKISYFGFWTMFVFLFILIIGFVYEWKKGALDWE